MQESGIHNRLWRRTVCSATAAAVVLGCWAGAAHAAGGEVEVRAAVSDGKPFGVGRLVVPIGPKAMAAIGKSDLCDFEFLSALRLTDKDSRVLYPVVADGEITLSEEDQDEPVTRIGVDFLFRGREPLNLTFAGAAERPCTVTVKPVVDAVVHRRMLGDWWDAYVLRIEELAEVDLFSPQVDNYCAAMLSRRLGLRRADLRYSWSGFDHIDRLFALLLGAESVRVAMQQDTLLKRTDAAEAASLPLPEGVSIPEITLPDFPKDVKIEPIAMRVPAECFYIRCGSYANFRWMRATMDDWGGSVRNLAAVRARDYSIRARLERQLALRETVLARMLGDMVIADVAVIGTDTFVREGAAIGILFEARNEELLRTQLVTRRRKALEANKDATMTTVNIGGHAVSLLATPGNSIRSFYASDGRFHLVTTSRELARRFLETGAGRDPLGAAAEFRYARSKVPLDRADTVFIYLSDAFFRNLVGPRYRVEMTRRMRALTDIELVHMARLAARGEGRKADTIEQLVAGGFLPPHFTRRSDGSRSVLRDGRIVDSLRGHRGVFLPVPDVKVPGVTPSELRAYKQFASLYRGQWQRMDPVIVAIRRQLPAAAGNVPVERVSLDIYITPYARMRYGPLEDHLGTPTQERLGPVAGDLVSLDVATDIDDRGFMGLRDFEPEFTVRNGDVVPAEGWFDKYPWGYLGEVPQPKYLRRFFGKRMWWEKDKDGYCTSGQYWGRQTEDFAVWANNRKTLETVTPQLKLMQAPREAQLWLRIGDLSQAKLRTILHAYGYMRERKVSAANVFLLENLMRQFRVAREEALGACQQILGAKLACPLGGRYVPDQTSHGSWRSTAWRSRTIAGLSDVPEGYRFASLEWLRGMELEFVLDQDTLRAHVELRLKPRFVAGEKKNPPTRKPS